MNYAEPVSTILWNWANDISLLSANNAVIQDEVEMVLTVFFEDDILRDCLEDQKDNFSGADQRGGEGSWLALRRIITSFMLIHSRLLSRGLRRGRRRYWAACPLWAERLCTLHAHWLRWSDSDWSGERGHTQRSRVFYWHMRRTFIVQNLLLIFLLPHWWSNDLIKLWA